jgi:hypothetical protein
VGRLPFPLVGVLNFDFLGILGLPLQEPEDFVFGLGEPIAAHQPDRAFGHEEPPENHEDGGDNRDRVHPAPRSDVRIFEEDHKPNAGADETPHSLEGKRCQHQAAARPRRDTFGDHHVRGRVVTAERYTGPKEAEDQDQKVWSESQRHEKQGKNHHLGDEHFLPPYEVGQAPQHARPNEDPGQLGSGYKPFVVSKQPELLRDQRQRDAGYEDDQSLEKFSGARQAEDAQLHPGQLRKRGWRTVRPCGHFVEVFLDRFHTLDSEAQFPATPRISQ